MLSWIRRTLTRLTAILVKLTLLCLLVGTLFGVYFYPKIDDEVRLRTKTELQKIFPKLEIALGSAKLCEAQRIRCRDLRFFAPGNDGQAKRCLLEIEELIFHCPQVFEKCLNGDFRAAFKSALEIESIEILRPHFYLSCNEQEITREIELFQMLDTGKKPCPISLVEGTLEFTLNETPANPEQKAVAHKIVVREINAAFFPNQGKPDNVNKSVSPESAEMEREEIFPPKETAATALIWTFGATACGDWVQRIQLEGSFDTKSKHWTLNGAVEQLYCSTSFWAFAESLKKSVVPPKANINTIPSTITPPRKKFDLRGLLHSIHGDCSLTFQAARDTSVPSGVQGVVKGHLQNGSVQVEYLKRPVAKFGMKFQVDDKGLRINNCSGTYGDTQIRFAYHQPYFTTLEGTALRVKTDQAPIDKETIGRFSRILPGNLGALAEQFRQLSILAELETTWVRQHGRWTPQYFTLQGNRLILQHKNSLYRVDELEGNILLDHRGRLVFQFETSQTPSTPDLPTKVTTDFPRDFTTDFNEMLSVMNHVESMINSHELSRFHQPISSRNFNSIPNFEQFYSVPSNVSASVPTSETYSVRKSPMNESQNSDVLSNIPDDRQTERYTINQARFENPPQTFQPQKYSQPQSGPQKFWQPEKEMRVRISGVFVNSLTAPQGRIVANASSVPINAQLFETIPKKQRQIIESLRPAGYVNLTADLGFPVDWANREIQKKLIIEAVNGSICYDLFPYPVHEIYGTIVWDGVDWDFRDLRGKNESTQVFCNGSLHKTTGEYVLALGFEVEELPLEGHLKDALLQPGYKEIHQSINGSGKLNVDANIEFFPTTKKLSISFDAIPSGKQGISICPIAFPLRIDNVHGRIRFNNGVFAIKNLKGRSKGAEFSADVFCNISPEGAWEMNISPVVIYQLTAQDNDLLKAVPVNLRALVKNLRLDGPLNIDGDIRFTKRNAGSPLQTQWNTTLTMFQNQAYFGVPAKNVAGSIRVSGVNVGSLMSVDGELELESLFLNDVQFVRIKGPFHYDGKQILLGRDVSSPESQQPLARTVSAFAFRGQEPQNPLRRSNPSLNTNALPTAPALIDNAPTFSERMYAESHVGHPPVFETNVPQPATLQQPYSGFAPHRSLPEQNVFETLNAPLQQPLQQQTETNAANSVTSGPDRPVMDQTTAGHLISASVFGGNAFCRGRILMGEKNLSYNVHIDLVDAELQHLARDFRQDSETVAPWDRKSISGQLTASAHIIGEGKNTDTISGEGFVAIRKAYLYETPLMIKLLQRLSIRKPDRSAFSSSDIKFRIQGKKLLLDPVIFEGSTFSLEGNGDFQWDTNRKINLILVPKLGNRRNRILILSDIIGGGGELNQVHVEGSLNNPEVLVIPLPKMRSAFEQMQGN